MNNNLNNFLSIIKVSGEDAGNFLHNQLTQDINDLSDNQARLFGYCNIKGRLLANGILYKYNKEYYLILHSSLANNFIKRLSIYILRSKVKINLLEDYCINYVENSGIKANNESQFLALQIDNINNIDNISINYFQNKYLYIAYSSQKLPVQEKLSVLNLQHFKYDSILQGLFYINSNNQEEYVPQMLNFDKLGGINFKKGCYPGQEIVARSQYLGKIKKTTISMYINNLSLDKIDDLELELELQKVQIVHSSNTNDTDIASIVEYVKYNNIYYLLICIRSEYLEENNNFNITNPTNNLFVKLGNDALIKLDRCLSISTNS